MAFHQPGANGGGGSPAGGSAGGGEHHHVPQGTEYTLQGVMRFLQIEWHNHERARNAWDIERAEMKAKIAKQEGEVRHARRINEQLDRQVRMLEVALRNERKKAQNQNPSPTQTEQAKAVNGDGRTEKDLAVEIKVEKKEEESGKNGDAKPADGGADTANQSGEIPRPGFPPRNSFLETTADGQGPGENEREQYLDNTTKYLKNCMKEIQYLLTPPQHPQPPPQVLLNGNYTGLPEPPLSYEDMYSRQRHLRQQAPVLPQQSALPDHQPPPVPSSLPQTSAVAEEAGRGVRYDYANPSQPPSNISQAQAEQISQPPDEHIETVTHTFDAQGRPVPDTDAPQPARPLRPPIDADGWTFEDDPSVVHGENPPPGLPPPRRPDTDLFPSATNAPGIPAKSPPRASPGAHRRKSSGSQAMARRRSSQGRTEGHDGAENAASNDPSQFRVRFALRGHLDVVRSVIFTGGGSPSEPEICTACDDSTIKRWIIPATYQNFNPVHNNSDLDISAYFTHRGHEGIVTSLATCPVSTGFSTGGRANGDGWIFSGGQDATIRVWERGRVDPKATLEGHTDAVWAVCILPATVGQVFGPQSNQFGGPDRLLLVSGSADGTVKVWAVSSPPQVSSPSSGSRRGVGGTRRHSVTSGSNFPSSPQPSVASTTPFHHNLIHSIERRVEGDGATTATASPTSICPLSPTGETFVVSYTDSSVLVFDTRSGEEIIGMASNETYDGTLNTSINSVVATSLSLEGAAAAVDPSSDEVGGATGSREGVEGVVISGHEDRFVRFFDANSGQCTYTMLAHPSAIAALSLSKDGREAVSAGHDASIRFWSLEKRICTQDIISHRAMRGEGVCDVCWSQDGRLVVSAGGDGVVKVFAR